MSYAIQEKRRSGICHRSGAVGNPDPAVLASGAGKPSRNGETGKTYAATYDVGNSPLGSVYEAPV